MFKNIYFILLSFSVLFIFDSCSLVLQVKDEVSICGNDIIEKDEECDGNAPFDKTCSDFGYSEGTLSCTQNCTFDTNDCSNSEKELCDDGEDNDGDNLIDCEDPDCTDDDACVNNDYEICDNGIDDNGNGFIDCDDPYCESFAGCNIIYEICDNEIDDDGNGFIDCDDPYCESFAGCNITYEICDNGIDDDGDDLTDCEDPDCSENDWCLCGNNVIDNGEVCDGTNLNGQTCQSLGYYPGDLVCRSNCMVFDTSGCGGFCGNGIIEYFEQCDDQNTTSGDGCNSSCSKETGWDCTGTPSVCQPICGDGKLVGDETSPGRCDDNNSDDDDGCSSTCFIESGWHCTGTPSVCQPICGDNQALGDEECDGTDLNGQNCHTMGYATGFLLCDSTCHFDESNCEDPH